MLNLIEENISAGWRLLHHGRDRQALNKFERARSASCRKNNVVGLVASALGIVETRRVLRETESLDELIQQTIEQVRASAEFSSFDVAGVLDNFANYYDLENCSSKALVLSDEAVQLVRKHIWSGASKQVEPFLTRLCILMELKQVPEMSEAAKEALAIYRFVFGPNDASTIFVIKSCLESDDIAAELGHPRQFWYLKQTFDDSLNDPESYVESDAQGMMPLLKLISPTNRNGYVKPSGNGYKFITG